MMACCEGNCESKKRRKLSLPLLCVVALVVLVVINWQ